MAKIACLEAKVSQATINDMEEGTENEQDASNSYRGHKALEKAKRGKQAGGGDGSSG